MYYFLKKKVVLTNHFFKNVLSLNTFDLHISKHAHRMNLSISYIMPELYFVIYCTHEYT